MQNVLNTPQMHNADREEAILDRPTVHMGIHFGHATGATKANFPTFLFPSVPRRYHLSLL